MRMGRETIFTWPTAMPSEKITSRDVSTVDALGLLMERPVDWLYFHITSSMLLPAENVKNKK